MKVSSHCIYLLVCLWNLMTDVLSTTLPTSHCLYYSGIYTLYMHIFLFTAAAMHSYANNKRTNHVSYMSLLKEFNPKNAKNIQPPPAFTFVREPLSHFVSGLAEYHFRCSAAGRLISADDIRQVTSAQQIIV